MVLLDALTLGDANIKPLQALGNLQIYPTTSKEQRVNHIGDAEVVITNKVIIDQEILMACPQLKLICVAATGMNNIDLETARERGVAVKNVAGYSTSGVVQHTFALLFSLLHQTEYYASYVRDGEWKKSMVFTHLGRSFWELGGKRWGIIGLGEIGRGVAKIACSFGAEVVYASTSGIHRQEEYEKVSLEELMQTAQVVSIHAPLNEKTHGLIGEKELGWLPEGSILLNVGRGGIIDEAALVKALNGRKIFAGLDVLEEEPMKLEHPFDHITHPERLLVTPHIAWSSVESRERLVEGITKNIQVWQNKNV